MTVHFSFPICFLYIRQLFIQRKRLLQHGLPFFIIILIHKQQSHLRKDIRPYLLRFRLALQYFQRTLKNTGVIEALENKGIKEGDTVSIYGIEFDFVY